jgi:hypothetical protein
MKIWSEQLELFWNIWTKIGGLDLEGGGGVPILAVKPFTPQEVVRVDETTLSALQIFNQRWQNSGKILQSKLLLLKWQILGINRLLDCKNSSMTIESVNFVNPKNMSFLPDF